MLDGAPSRVLEPRWAIAADHMYVTLPTELAADGVALPPGLAEPRFADASAAMDWMAAEQHVLMALVRHACAHGFDTYAWRLAHAQSCNLMLRRRWHDDIRQAGLAVAAAERTGDACAVAHVQRQLGRAHVFVGEYEAGMLRLRKALAHYEAAGDVRGLAETHRSLGALYYLRDEFEQAERHHRIQLEHARELGHRRSITVALCARAECLARLGRHELALPVAAQSLAVAESIGAQRHVYSAWDVLGQIHHGLGNAQASSFCYRRGLEVCAGRDRRLVGSDLIEARTAAAEGDPARARRLCREIRDAPGQIDPEQAKSAELMLAELGAGPGTRPIRRYSRDIGDP